MNLIESLKGTVERIIVINKADLDRAAKFRLGEYTDFPHAEDCPKQSGLAIIKSVPLVTFGGSFPKSLFELECVDCGVKKSFCE